MLPLFFFPETAVSSQKLDVIGGKNTNEPPMLHTNKNSIYEQSKMIFIQATDPKDFK